MIQRDNLTIPEEVRLPEKLAPIMTLDQFGNWVTHILKKNNTSWLHYNLASMYWRLRGKAPKAIECSRRAIHYAPRLTSSNINLKCFFLFFKLPIILIIKKNTQK